MKTFFKNQNSEPIPKGIKEKIRAKYNSSIQGVHLSQFQQFDYENNDKIKIYHTKNCSEYEINDLIENLPKDYKLSNNHSYVIYKVNNQTIFIVDIDTPITISKQLTIFPDNRKTKFAVYVHH